MKEIGKCSLCGGNAAVLMVLRGIKVAVNEAAKPKKQIVSNGTILPPKL